MLHYIQQTNSKRIILFVHGFIGGKETWMNNDKPNPFINYILEDAEIKSSYDLAVFDYYTQLSDLTESISLLKGLFGFGSKSRKNLSVSDIGNTLISEIDIKLKEYENIVLVGHSMGGLVSKHVILHYLENEGVSKINLFLSLAVPHNGSNLADIGKIILSNPQVKDLAPLETNIHQLNSARVKSKHLPITVYYQGQYDRIVPPTSSISYDQREAVEVVYTEHDHFSILKPTSNQEVIVISIIQQLKKALIQQKKSFNPSTLPFMNENYIFKDEQMGYQITLPISVMQDDIQKLSYMELLSYLLNKPMDPVQLESQLVVDPFGTMRFNSLNTVFKLGDIIALNLNEHSSNEDFEDLINRINHYNKTHQQAEITEKELKDLKLQYGFKDFSILFPVGLYVSKYEKKNAIAQSRKPAPVDILKQHIININEPIEEIKSNPLDNSLSYKTKLKYLDIEVNGKRGNFTIYRIYKIVESQDAFFMLQANWSPDTNSVITVYNQLEAILNSFKVH